MSIEDRKYKDSCDSCWEISRLKEKAQEVKAEKERKYEKRKNCYKRSCQAVNRQTGTCAGFIITVRTGQNTHTDMHIRIQHAFNRKSPKPEWCPALPAEHHTIKYHLFIFLSLSVHLLCISHAISLVLLLLLHNHNCLMVSCRLAHLIFRSFS